MASTYSTSLKIQLIGNGEQSGIWGSTTDANWNLMEQAVAGVQTITMSNADYTLSNLNGVSDEARNMVLVVQGTNSAIYKVVAPLVPKFYVVSNQTVGGYSITIGGSSGSYITIPNGYTSQVYCDGINFYAAQTSSAGNWNVSGNLTVGGNTTITGSLTVTGGSNIVPTGTLLLWPTGTAPSGYLLCNGAAISRTTYASLFAVIGTTFGVGDGSSTFNLPNYVDRTPIGAGGSYAVGATGGSATTTLSTTNIPSHTHTFAASTTTSTGYANISDPGHVHAISDPTHTHGINDPGHSHGVYDPGHSHSTYSAPGFNSVCSGGCTRLWWYGSPALNAGTGGSGTGIGIYGATTGVYNSYSGTGISINNHTTGISDAGHTHAYSFSGTTGTTGSGSAISTISPYLAIYYVIKM